MTSVKNLCLLLVKRGKTEGLQEKLDVFYAMGRLSEEEYKTLCGMLPQEWEQE